MLSYELVMANRGVYHIVDQMGKCIWTIKSETTDRKGQSRHGQTFFWKRWSVDYSGFILGEYTSLAGCLQHMDIQFSNWPGPYHILKRSGVPDPNV